MTLDELITKATDSIEKQQYAEAIDVLEAALCIKPSYWFTSYLMGTVLCLIQKDGMAIQFLMRAIESNPKCYEAIFNLGNSMRRLGHTDSALMIYKQAADLKQSDQVMAALAGCHINNGDPERAIEWCDKALNFSGQKHDDFQWKAKHHKAMALLELGRLDEGFDLYRARYHIPEWTKRCYTQPLWNGEKTGTLLIHGEQGIGDEILFMSWLPKIRHLYDKLVIEATPRLVETFKRSFQCDVFENDKQVMESGIPIDAVVPMGSLPHFAGGLPPHGRYLIPDEEKVKYYRESLYTLGEPPYIGLSWHGGVIKTHTHLRTTEYSAWKKLKQGTCISIQYGKNGEYAKTLGIPHWQDAIEDIDSLIALIAALDLVVTVNNTSVHMAGALNVPCWTLTPSKPAWRYQLTGDMMPWYGSVRQFRQNGNDWDELMGRVSKELAHYCDHREMMKVA